MSHPTTYRIRCSTCQADYYMNAVPASGFEIRHYCGPRPEWVQQMMWSAP